LHVKFTVDNSAGKLARYLRALGFDTVLSVQPVTGRLLAEAERQGRIVLTRKRSFGFPAPSFCRVLGSEEPRQQLRQVLAEFRPVHPRFTRCIVCNALLDSVDKAAVENKVPPYVFRTHEGFSRCPACDRYYWKGTHWVNMNSFFDRLLGDVP
jgi:uncharacterized protein with PIN domain